MKRLPETSTYRVSVESATKQKLDIVESTEDLDLIEKTINDGQLEQLIEQAKAEIKLISKMEEWKVKRVFDCYERLLCEVLVSKHDRFRLIYFCIRF